ncbi:hypothetical protein AB0B45_47890 [Nonomuraea sp. NPDC049152]|uniref:hypothetical protein n=1 Tax=Nonomuraea sp. NPDC049152 TaxID=3154350 RepID=UPI0033D0F136
MLKNTIRTLVAVGSAVTATFAATGPARAAADQVCYEAHVQNVGWMGWQCDGAVGGTIGRSLNLESVRFKVNAGELCVKAYRSHYGWDSTFQCAKPSKTVQIGTTGMNAPMEAILFYYRNGNGSYIKGKAHSRNIGWTDQYDTGTYRTGYSKMYMIGTTGRSLPMEALTMWWV